MSVSARDYANGGTNGYAVDPPSPSPKSPNGQQHGTPATVQAIKQQDEAAGAVVHSFDQDASPEDKKAQALKSSGGKPQMADMSALASKLPGNSAAAGSGLSTDLGGKKIKPSIGLDDVQATSHEEGQKGDGSGQEVVPGAMPAKQAQAIPDWYRVGWSGQFAVKGQVTDPVERQSRDLLETWVSDMYYGTWYHNALIIFFAVAASHYATVFGGGWVSLFIILATCSTYYTTSTRRVRRNIRDDVSRQLARTKLFTDHETVGWMNNFLQRFWLIYEPVLSATIVASVDAVLEASTPSFLESLRLSTFTLGTKAPHIDFIRTHPETADDEVVMDWMINFTPNDTADMKVSAAEAKVNPKIVLGVRFGKAGIGITKSIVVEDIMFKGEMRIRLKLMNNFPHIQTVDLSFLSKPDFDFILRPVGFDINMIPGLSGFIHSQVHANLGPMMYDPNVFTLNMEQMLAGAPIDTAVGVLQVTAFHAQGLKAVKLSGGSPDPYVSFSIGSHPALDHTKIKHSTNTPHWNSTHFLLINNLTDVLSMTIMDHNSTRKDDKLGIANFDLATLTADSEQEGLMAPIMNEGKPRGEIRFDVNFLPCLMPKKLENGTEEPIPETSTGVLRLTLHQGKDLDTKKTSTNNLATYANFYINGKPCHKTSVIKRTANPVYENFTEILVSDKAGAVIGIKIMNDKMGEDAMLGFVNVKLNDILEANAKQQDWFPLVGARSGKIRLSAVWKPVLMSGAINGAGAYKPPIGVLKFWFKKANDLKNVEAITGGKSDPYVRIMRSGIVLQRSQIFNNNLDPEFDEIIYVPIHDGKESLRLELMDYQHMGKDRSLGYHTLDVKELLTAGADAKTDPYASTGKRAYKPYLKVDEKGSFKGQIDFEVTFCPCTHLKTTPFAQPESSLDKAKIDGDSDGASTINESIDERVTEIADDEMVANFANVASGKLHVRAQTEDEDRGGNGLLDPMSEEVADRQSILSHEEEGIEMAKSQIMDSQSGILVFNIMSGEVARKNARLEVLFDDGYWPTCLSLNQSKSSVPVLTLIASVDSTEATRSVNAKWDETGEGFIRELDWSQIILKLNTAEKETREEVYAQFTTSLRSFIEECLDTPHEFVLQDLTGGNRSTVMIQCKYIPVTIQLEPRESINNMGMLTVLVDNAKDLKAADRNGYSDPWAQFTLNNMKIHKTEVQKRTLNPKWNEKFEIEVPSRVHANFVCEVFDWDRVGTSDKLGRGSINLADLEPMTQTPYQVKLSDASGSQGTVNIRLTFRPGFVVRTRQATSTFSGAGRVASNLGGGVVAVGAGVGNVGVGVVKGVGHGVKGVGHGVGSVGKLGFSGVRKVAGHGHKKTLTATSINDDGTLLDGTPLGALATDDIAPNSLGLAPQVQRMNSSHGSTGSVRASTPSGGQEGKLVVKLTSASTLGDADARSFCIAKLAGKTIHETKSIKNTDSPRWDETFTIDTLASNACLLDFTVLDKKSFGRDKELGSARVDVWQHVSSSQTQADITIPLKGGGQASSEAVLTLQLGLKPNTNGFLDSDPNTSTTAPGSPTRSQRSASVAKSRFSIHRDRS